MLRAILEIMRIMVLLVLLGALLGYAVKSIYSAIGIADEGLAWSSVLGIYMLIFVLYRNKLQFSGWYAGEGRVRLPARATRFYLIISVLLIVLPAFT